MNWWAHRVATSDLYHVSPHEIRSSWTWFEVLEANAVIDAFEEAREMASEE